MAGRLFFTAAYWLGFAPWNTGETPPEVFEYLTQRSPGRALDLGCGTGTNVITLAQTGWMAEGVDYVPRAIRIARRKASKAGLEDKTAFRIGSVLDSGMYRGGYDLILDIGCFHSLSSREMEVYSKLVSSHLVSGGSLLLYVHLRVDPDEGHGASESDLGIIEQDLDLVQRVNGEESSRPSAWLHFSKA